MRVRFGDAAWQRVGSYGLAYLVLGVGSAAISNDLASATVQASVRVGILLVAVALLIGHLHAELVRSAAGLGASALRTSSAVALGTFLLAVYAVSMSWWDSSQLPASLLSALVVWPVATGLPAFLAALVVGRVLVRGKA